MTITESQKDMRLGYLAGAPGLLVSGAVWLSASAVAAFVSPGHSMWTLVLAGMVIHPVAIALTKMLGGTGKHTTGNPLSTLALEGTIWFIVGIAIAVVLGMTRLDLFFSAMLLLIGGRYLTFHTVYGLKFYWGVGGALVVVGVAAAFLRLPVEAVSAAGGGIEIVAGVLLLRQARR